MKVITTLAFLMCILFQSMSAQTVEENVTFNHNGCTFKGTISKPSGSGPFPAILLVPGSGQNDRNGTIAMSGSNVSCLYPDLVGEVLTPYKDLALQLSDSGYAVLRYDELTVSCPSFSGEFSFETVWFPMNSALDYLKTRIDIDTTKLILVGHSEGSMLIPYAARQRHDIRAMISLAGARTPFDSIIARQTVDIARLCGQDTVQAKQQAQQILLYYYYIRNQKFTGLLPFGGVGPEEWYPYINANDSVAINYEISAIPTLFVGFGQDFNVPPSELNRFQQELNGDFDFYSIAGITHYMTPRTGPSVPRMIGDTLVYWLRENFSIGLSESPSNEKFVSCFPNPFNDRLSVQLNEELHEGALLQVTNPGGKILYEKRLVKSEIRKGSINIDLGYLPPQVYTVILQSQDRLYRTKIVKSK